MRSGRTSRSVVAVAVLALPFLASAAQTRAPAEYRISGVVVSTRDRAPLPYAHLVLSGATAPAQASAQTETPGSNRFRRGAVPDRSLETNADATGHFSLNAPSAGAWHLSANAPGYRTQLLDQHENFSTDIVLTPEHLEYRMVFALAPDPVLSGTVRDEAGEPVRSARVVLYGTQGPLEGNASRGVARQGPQAVTDDLGHYELSGLAPGDYKLAVVAQPWYAQASHRAMLGRSSDATGSDPALDVVYPLTWFPGTADAERADLVSLRAGETMEADFNLLPVPSLHVRLPVPATPLANGPQQFRGMPQIQRVGAVGLPEGPPMTSIAMRGNQIEVGGLTPGMYEVRSPGNEGAVSFLRLTGAQRTSLDASSLLVPAARVKVKIEGVGPETRPRVLLTDVQTGSVFGINGRGDARRRGADGPEEQTSELPPGRYKVTVNGPRGVHLESIGNPTGRLPGNLVEIGAGTTELSVRITQGHASVRGVATREGRPSVAAMVLLVSASSETAGNTAAVLRDQTNTDGSFEIADALPGPYILVSIENGWQVNWHDPGTLQRYLLHGTPVVLNAEHSLEQRIESVLP